MAPLSPDEAKRCCADLYASDWLRMLLGDSLHPGGLSVTERMGTLLGLNESARVLDVATGVGATALGLAQRFGCHAVGVDYGERNIREAMLRASAAGLSERVHFILGDAECLPLASGAFDAVICECAFSTFADKRMAAREFRRVLSPGGKLGFSDVTRMGALPAELEGDIAKMACVSDACSADEYRAFLAGGGFSVGHVEPHDDDLLDLVRDLRRKLVGAQLLAGLSKIPTPGVDFAAMRAIADRTEDSVNRGALGYIVVLACAV